LGKRFKIYNTLNSTKVSLGFGIYGVRHYGSVFLEVSEENAAFLKVEVS
jgi:hypothetical protein